MERLNHDHDDRKYRHRHRLHSGPDNSAEDEAGEPAHYKFNKTVTYQTADGRVIEASKIRKDSKVRVHYIKSGDDMLVDKVIVTDRD